MPQLASAFAISSPLRLHPDRLPRHRCCISRPCHLLPPPPCTRFTTTTTTTTTTTITTKATASTSPPDHPAILSIDVGTSSTKAALVHATLAPPTHAARHTYPTLSPAPRHVTQRPSDWHRAALHAARDALCTAPGVQVLAISVTGTSHSPRATSPATPHHNPDMSPSRRAGHMQDLIAVGPGPPSLLSDSALLYSDARAHVHAHALSAQLAMPIAPTSLLAKLHLLPRAARARDYSLLLGAADAVVHALCAEAPLITDATTVSTTGLSLAPTHRRYDTDLLTRAGLADFIPSLPTIQSTPGVVGTLSAVAADHLGRRDLAGLPVVHAGGDAFSATVGAGADPAARSAAPPYLYAGTSGWVASVSPTARAAPRDGLFALAHAAAADRRIVAASVGAVGAALSSGAALAGCQADALDALASTQPVGAQGATFVPYLSGRRCPRPRNDTTAALLGLSDVGREHACVARAVCEGVTFALAEAAATLQTEGVSLLTPIRCVGGVRRCRTVVTGVAALLGDVEVVDVEPGVVGAALTAARALRVPGFEHAVRASGEIVSVRGTEREQWAEAFAKWRRAVAACEMLWDASGGDGKSGGPPRSSLGQVGRVPRDKSL